MNDQPVSWERLAESEERLQRMRAVADRLAEAIEPVLRISDRKTDVWDNAKRALAEYRKAVAG